MADNYTTLTVGDSSSSSEDEDDLQLQQDVFRASTDADLEVSFIFPFMHALFIVWLTPMPPPPKNVLVSPFICKVQDYSMEVLYIESSAKLKDNAILFKL